jgi:hypothetical protein
VHSEHEGDSILSDLYSVRIKLLVHDLQTGGEELLDAPWDFLHHLQQNFFSDAISHQKNQSNNCIIIIVLSITMFMEVQYLMNIQIQIYK